MAKIIASTYEVIKQIGSGGGGTVYLANHIRLGKLVVLKADKRRITTRPELLRREVDILKELRHPNIPIVYDYFVEDDITYTVMDFVEGESLDKPLKRGEHFSQSEIIKWAKQLLEALSYLHSPTHGDPPKGFVHSDIKPANLMCTPDGNICLIDFNIALALGEENLIGHSEGYASPEHYGLDYSLLGGEQTLREAETKAEFDEDATETIEDEKETVLIQREKSSYKKVIPDVRSDIYSVGATLYHLLSGRRPAKYADQVIPLSKEQFNPQIVKIISKAMNPNPNLRYQTAEDMLRDIKSLRENDPRTKWWKRQNRIVRIGLLCMFCTGILVSFVGLKRMQLAEKNQKLAEYSEDALQAGDRAQALRYALETTVESKNIIAPGKVPEVQKALTDALGVYDLESGFKKSGLIELEKNLLYLTVSSDGKYAACMYDHEIAVINLETLKKMTVLPAEDSAMAEVEFLDCKSIVYAGEDGICAYDFSAERVLWTGESATAIGVSGDGSTVAALYKGEKYAVVYDAKTGQKVKKIDFSGRSQAVTMVSDSFANPYGNLFELSEDGKKLAVSFEDGSLTVFELEADERQLDVLDEKSGYTYFAGGFNKNYLAFSATKSDGSIFAVIDTDSEKQMFGLEAADSFHAAADGKGIYVQIKNILVRVNPVTGEQIPLVTVDETIERFSAGENYTAISTDNKILIFDSDANPVTQFNEMGQTGLLRMAGDVLLSGKIDTPELSVMKYEDNSEAEIAKYDPSFEHDEARISSDEKRIMLFSYKQFRICELDGEIIAEVQLPKNENIYDQQYIRDEQKDYLKVVYKTGNILCYDAETGQLISEEKEKAPDLELNEEFFTDNFRIYAPLHGAPQVYDIETGERICELDEDSFLIYVSETGDNIVAQYVTAEGFRYGVLMDSECREIGYLPFLCDIKDKKLYFDYPSAGSVRKSHMYDLNTLINLAKEKLE